MTIANKKELLRFLSELKKNPNKKLSQNFLIDKNVVEKSLAHIKAGDRVIEIGPGPGALTELLLEKGAHVIAIEKDPDFAKALERFDTGKLEVIEGDARLFSYSDYGPIHVCGNLPYHITQDILSALIAHHESILSVSIMIQEDARCRLMSSKTYFSLFFQYYTKVLDHFLVSKHCFYPEPSVESTVMHCRFEKRYPVEDETRFFKAIKQAFLQKRKVIRKTISEYLPEGNSLPENARPEELTLEMWAALFGVDCDR